MSRINIITKISVFSAISFILMRFFEFPVPFFWPELKYDISDVPAAIIGFSISPLAGISVILIKNALHLITGFNFIGVTANTFVGVIFVGTSSLLYSRDRRLKTAIKGMLFGSLLAAVVMMPVNLMLVKLFTGGEMQNIERMVFFSMPTFNLAKGFLNTAITYFLYKRVSRAFLRHND